MKTLAAMLSLVFVFVMANVMGAIDSRDSGATTLPTVQTAPQPVQTNPEVIPAAPLSLDPRDHGGKYGNPSMPGGKAAPSHSQARAADEPTLSEDIALVATGLIVCYPELREDPVRNSVLGKLTDILAGEPEAERVAAGKKVTAMVKADKRHFCASIAYGVSKALGNR